IEIGRDVPVVAADQEKLRRIVENLVSNAIKYVAVGGRVSVTVTYDYGSNRLGIVVSDNGCGISEEDIPLVFDRFVRGSASKQSSGSGLGLALVKELVDFYGGTIEVASEVGRGSLFTVQLPVKPLGIDDEME
ncbi:MAG: ATP-binding protein, partial [Raoultibacter sp.]